MQFDSPIRPFHHVWFLKDQDGDGVHGLSWGFKNETTKQPKTKCVDAKQSSCFVKIECIACQGLGEKRMYLVCFTFICFIHRDGDGFAVCCGSGAISEAESLNQLENLLFWITSCFIRKLCLFLLYLFHCSNFCVFNKMFLNTIH